MTDFNTKECAAAVEDLSPQLREVLRQKSRGLANKQIADVMGLSESTVRIYLERIYSRLGVNNVALATRVAVRAGLL